MPRGGFGGAQPKLGGAPAGNDRAALLKSIQAGKALKKTVTNDRSAPVVGGKSASRGPPSAGGSPGSSAGSSPVKQGGSAPASRLPGIGGLFADGEARQDGRGLEGSGILAPLALVPPHAAVLEEIWDVDGSHVASVGGDDERGVVSFDDALAEDRRVLGDEGDAQGRHFARIITPQCFR